MNKELTRDQKIEWMAVWCAKNNLKLELEGTCGLFRECVGVSTEEHYPDYMWYEKGTYERLDNNGEVWTPENAYHKHPCVAVLGRGEEAEDQLYQWLKWFQDEGFVLETGDVEVDPSLGAISFLLGHHRYARMVRK